MYTKIVVPYDHSPLSKKALETAMMMAKQDEKTELNVITVIPVVIPTSYHNALNVETQRQVQLKVAGEILDEVAQKLKVLPNKSNTMVLEGNPGEKTIEFVKENGADLIVMGSRGLGGLKELFLGSVSHYVVQKASCPVFIIK